MDNVYLIYGDEEFLIDKEIKNIIYNELKKEF